MYVAKYGSFPYHEFLAVVVEVISSQRRCIYWNGAAGRAGKDDLIAQTFELIVWHRELLEPQPSWMALACCGRGRDDDYFCHAGEMGFVEILLCDVVDER